MSYQEKRTVVTLVSGALVLLSYCLYAFGRYQAGLVMPGDLKFWAGTMLIFIGVGIVAMIVIQIVFHILLSIAIAVKEEVTNGKCDDKKVEKMIELEMVEDEMDKLIELKSMRIGFVVVGVGFVAALISLVMNYSAAVMINILFLSFSVGTLCEGFLSLRYYRKGV
jgi:hypothetical protein